jgi:threonyl-tRNA synthetase
LPLWLSPVQVVVMNISAGQADYAGLVAKELRAGGLRVELDLRGEKINYKIREHSLLKRPYFVVVGDKEKAAGLVAVRARGNHDLGQMSPEALLQRLLREKQSKGAAA